MLNFAWWWVFFALPLPIIVRLLSKKDGKGMLC